LSGIEEREAVWIGIWPVEFYRPTGFAGWQFDYRLTVHGASQQGVRTEASSWGTVKSLFRD
jgi:hypothetical protein